MKTAARVVLVDIETAPSLGYVWGKWEQDVIEFKQDWYILSFSYKNFGEKKIYTRALVDYPGFSKDKENDESLVADLWAILDGADIVIGHNLEKFDIKKTNTRFISHGMPPPSPYRTVDTLKLARKVFKFDSNKLDELGRYLGIGRKLAHTGFRLWLGCMNGDAASWKLMKKYNEQDVALLEKVYLLMRPWAGTHPNVNKGGTACPKCGSIEVQKRGFSYTLLRQKQRYQCLTCRGWWDGSAKVAEKS